MNKCSTIVNDLDNCGLQFYDYSELKWLKTSTLNNCYIIMLGEQSWKHITLYAL